MEGQKHTVCITGAAGYVGAMLADQFSRRADVEKIICLDKEPQPRLISGRPNIFWIQANTSDDSWQKKVAVHAPDIVIHAAWQIREMYGKNKIQWKWNVNGSQNVFAFAFDTPSVKRLVHFSTASVYGAFRDNTLEHYFKEAEPMREAEYLYGVEKRAAEEALTLLSKKEPTRLAIYTIRPAAITGPRGRGMEHRFGLQASLSGRLRGSFLYSIIRLWVFMVPAPKGWVRQFVHEDDVTDIVALLAFGESKGAYEIFNLTPPGKPVYPEDMAKAVGKRVLRVSPWMVRLAFFWIWHATLGKIPTAKASWKFYSYPVLMDGSKITSMLGYRYQFPEPNEAFIRNEGRYAQKLA